MHEVTIEVITEVLKEIDPATGKRRAFAIIADKATVFGRTGQMHGIIVMVDGVLVPVFVGVRLVGDECRGVDLAKLLVEFTTGGEPLNLTTQQLREQLAGSAFDGQYEGQEQGNSTGLAVPRKLAELIDLDADWNTSTWDGGHLIELAMNDVRKDPRLQFYVRSPAYIRTHACDALSSAVRSARCECVCTAAKPHCAALHVCTD